MLEDGNEVVLVLLLVNVVPNVVVDGLAGMSSVSIELSAVLSTLPSTTVGDGVVAFASCPPHHTVEPGRAEELGRGHQVEGGYGHHLLVVYEVDEVEVVGGGTVLVVPTELLPCSGRLLVVVLELVVGR